MTPLELIVAFGKEQAHWRQESPGLLTTIWLLDCHNRQIDFDDVLDELKGLAAQGHIRDLLETGEEEADLPSAVFAWTASGEAWLAEQPMSS